MLKYRLDQTSLRKCIFIWTVKDKVVIDCLEGNMDIPQRELPLSLPSNSPHLVNYVANENKNKYHHSYSTMEEMLEGGMSRSSLNSSRSDLVDKSDTIPTPSNNTNGVTQSEPDDDNYIHQSMPYPLLSINEKIIPETKQHNANQDGLNPGVTTTPVVQTTSSINNIHDDILYNLELGSSSNDDNVARENRLTNLSTLSFRRNEMDTPGPMHPEFYITGIKNKEEFLLSGIDPIHQPHLRYGRPDLSNIFERVAKLCEKENISRVAVVTCGPSPMINDVVTLSRKKINGVSFDCHHEVFQF